MMTDRKTILLRGTAVLALVTLLAGCDIFGGDGGNQQQPTFDETSSVNPDDRLSDLFEARPIAPAKITTSTSSVTLRMVPGGSDRASIRFINEGGAEARINSIISGTPSDELTIGGSCVGLEVLTGGRACDVTLQYNDSSNRSYTTSLLFFSNAQEGNDIRIPIEIVVQEVSDPTRQTQQQVEEEQFITEIYNPLAEEIARLRADRLAIGVGRWSDANRPPEVETRSVKSDEGYDRTVFASVDTSLPVDRSRILTPDRVIPAILETPIHSSITGNIVAVTSQHVYAPTGDGILIPAGSRFIGITNGYADERAALVWQRFITPDGVTVRMNGATQDQMGRAGAVGYLDRRLWDRFGIPLMLSTLRAAATFSFGQDEEVITDSEGNISQTETPENRAIDGFRQDVEGTAERIVQEYANVRQVMSVPAGTRLLITPTEDLYFKSEREVVSINSIEYELEQSDRRPVIAEAPPQRFEADAASAVTNPEGFSGDGSIITIDGREFKLLPVSPEEELRRIRIRQTLQPNVGFVAPQPGFATPQPQIQQTTTQPVQSQPSFEDGYFRSAPR